MILTAGAKLPLRSSVDTPGKYTERLGIFLKAHGAHNLTSVPIKPGIHSWTGWRFVVQQCATKAFPAPRSGEFDPVLRDAAASTERVTYVYRGGISAAPPDPARALGYFEARLLRPLNLGGQSRSFYVVLIYPKDCPAVTELPWRAL